jgi:Poly(ADP-ribose) polymerase catalytic domain
MALQLQVDVKHDAENQHKAPIDTYLPSCKCIWQDDLDNLSHQHASLTTDRLSDTTLSRQGAVDATRIAALKWLRSQTDTFGHTCMFYIDDHDSELELSSVESNRGAGRTVGSSSSSVRFPVNITTTTSENDTISHGHHMHDVLQQGTVCSVAVLMSDKTSDGTDYDLGSSTANTYLDIYWRPMGFQQSDSDASQKLLQHCQQNHISVKRAALAYVQAVHESQNHEHIEFQPIWQQNADTAAASSSIHATDPATAVRLVVPTGMTPSTHHVVPNLLVFQFTLNDNSADHVSPWTGWQFSASYATAIDGCLYHIRALLSASSDIPVTQKSIVNELAPTQDTLALVQSIHDARRQHVGQLQDQLPAAILASSALSGIDTSATALESWNALLHDIQRQLQSIHDCAQRLNRAVYDAEVSRCTIPPEPHSPTVFTDHVQPQLMQAVEALSAQHADQVSTVRRLLCLLGYTVERAKHALKFVDQRQHLDDDKQSTSTNLIVQHASELLTEWHRGCCLTDELLHTVQCIQSQLATLPSLCQSKKTLDNKNQSDVSSWRISLSHSQQWTLAPSTVESTSTTSGSLLHDDFDDIFGELAADDIKLPDSSTPPTYDPCSSLSAFNASDMEWRNVLERWKVEAERSIERATAQIDTAQLLQNHLQYHVVEQGHALRHQLIAITNLVEKRDQTRWDQKASYDEALKQAQQSRQPNAEELLQQAKYDQLEGLASLQRNRIKEHHQDSIRLGNLVKEYEKQHSIAERDARTKKSLPRVDGASLADQKAGASMTTFECILCARYSALFFPETQHISDHRWRQGASDYVRLLRSVGDHLMDMNGSFEGFHVQSQRAGAKVYDHTLKSRNDVSILFVHDNGQVLRSRHTSNHPSSSTSQSNKHDAPVALLPPPILRATSKPAAGSTAAIAATAAVAAADSQSTVSPMPAEDGFVAMPHHLGTLSVLQHTALENLVEQEHKVADLLQEFEQRMSSHLHVSAKELAMWTLQSAEPHAVWQKQGLKDLPLNLRTTYRHLLFRQENLRHEIGRVRHSIQICQHSGYFPLADESSSVRSSVSPGSFQKQRKSKSSREHRAESALPASRLPADSTVPHATTTARAAAITSVVVSGSLASIAVGDGDTKSAVSVRSIPTDSDHKDSFRTSIVPKTECYRVVASFDISSSSSDTDGKELSGMASSKEFAKRWIAANNETEHCRQVLKLDRIVFDPPLRQCKLSDPTWVYLVSEPFHGTPLNRWCAGLPHDTATGRPKISQELLFVIENLIRAIHALHVNCELLHNHIRGRNVLVSEQRDIKLIALCRTSIAAANDTHDQPNTAMTLTAAGIVAPASPSVSNGHSARAALSSPPSRYKHRGAGHVTVTLETELCDWDPLFCAPEILAQLARGSSHIRYSTASDVYMLGTVLADMLLGAGEFALSGAHHLHTSSSSDSPSDRLPYWKAGDLPLADLSKNSFLVSMITSMLHPDPQERAELSTCLAMFDGSSLLHGWKQVDIHASALTLFVRSGQPNSLQRLDPHNPNHMQERESVINSFYDENFQLSMLLDKHARYLHGFDESEESNKLIAEQFELHIDVERVQNTRLWRNYLIEVNLLLNSPAHLGQSHTEIERFLFHGSSHESLKNICTDGFSLRHLGSRGLVKEPHYGNGMYFATSSINSLPFAEAIKESETDLFPQYEMLLVRAIVGNYCRVFPLDGLSERDARAQRQEMGRHDSWVDNQLTPETFCIADVQRVYPAYVIKFKLTPKS